MGWPSNNPVVSKTFLPRPNGMTPDEVPAHVPGRGPVAADDVSKNADADADVAIGANDTPVAAADVSIVWFVHWTAGLTTIG